MLVCVYMRGSREEGNIYLFPDVSVLDSQHMHTWPLMAQHGDLCGEHHNTLMS